MRSLLSFALSLGFAVLATTPMLGQPASPIATVNPQSLPVGHQFEAVRYVTAREAHRVVTSQRGVVLIDVRTFEETIFNGVANVMRRHIPYLVADFDHSFDPVAGRYKLEPNPDFAAAVRNLLVEDGLRSDAVLIVYCSVGERSARAASLLARSGYAHVYSIADGFEADPRSGAGPGWKATLPWSERMSPAQAYKSPTL